MNGDAAIEVAGLEKSFGQLKVLDSVDLHVEAGTVFALLGPNGAGKTTLVRILSTLMPPDAGRATVAGFDVVREPGRVREAISLTGQYAAVDELLSGAENLRMMGRLCHLGRADTRRRTEELLKRFDLLDARDRRVKTYSGGMRRRLDLAISLLADPAVVFLDEPTTGLDPRSRQTMWDTIRELIASGVTIFLTTQYLEEADQLADRIAVIDEGAVVAEGTAEELKRRIPGKSVELLFGDEESFMRAAGALGDEETQADLENLAVRVAGDGSAAQVKHLLDRMERNGSAVERLVLREPTMDDVFLMLTGHTANGEEGR